MFANHFLTLSNFGIFSVWMYHLSKPSLILRAESGSGTHVRQGVKLCQKTVLRSFCET
jgi:hypothetical protein